MASRARLFRWRSLLALACLALVGSCKGRPGSASRQLVVAELLVSLRSLTKASLPANEDDVRGWVRERIGGKGALRLAAGGGPNVAGAYQLKVAVVLGRWPVPDGAAARPDTAVAVEVRGWVLAGDQPELNCQLVAPLPLGESLAGKHVRQPLDACLSAILRQSEWITGPASSVVTALGLKELQLLGDAARIAGQRRLRTAVEPLIALLQHPQREVSDRALGALIAIGDRRAVKALTRLAPLRDAKRLAQVIDGVAALGGPEAVSFLEFLAGGHAEPTIRRVAQAALERIRTGARGASTAPR